MKKNYIYNLLIIIFAILVFLGIGIIIKKDINKIEKHLEKCKKQCFPAGIIEQFSKKYCMCQPLIEPEIKLDKE